MSEQYSAAIEVRKSQRAAIAGLIGKIEFGPNESPLPEGFTPDHRYDDPFGKISERLFTNFISSIHDDTERELLSRESTLHGFYIIGKVLSYMPAIFNNFCEATDRHYDAADLATILKQSNGGFLSEMQATDNRRNTTYELNFGLLGYPTISGEQPFEFSLDEEKVSIDLNAQLLRATRIEIAQRMRAGDLDSINQQATCPASGRVTDIIWNEAVEACLAEGLFVCPEDQFVNERVGD